MAKLAFWVSVCCGAFLLGVLVTKQELGPYQILEDAYIEASMFISQLYQKRPDMLLKRRYKGEGVTRYKADRAYEGLTLLDGIFPEGVALRLVDMEGKVIHRWVMEFSRIWPDPDHVVPARNIPIDNLHYSIRGIWPLPDGSVVVNFSELGTAKVTKCGTVQWTVDRMTHHSITPNPDGTFWIPVKGDVREVPDALLLHGVSREDILHSKGWYEDRLMLVGADGKIEEEISVLEALIDGGFDRELFDAVQINQNDPTHLNDIDVVTEALAQKIDGAEAGDLLISIRQLHMIAIVSRNTGKINWSHSGPWIRQHDPDITDQGNIEIFNNGGWLDTIGGSNVISFDPATRRSSVLYPLPGQPNFYTYLMGSHQLLPNGNRLIIESLAGRVFEVDEAGDILWEYIGAYDDEYAALISGAIRFEHDYFTVSDWSCPEEFE